jgi:general stress protein YciG
MANKKTQRTSRQTSRGAASKLKMSTRRSAGRRPAREPEFGGMTVREAGRKGGLIGGRKGGLAVKAERGREFYQEIGRKGGQRVRDLIAAGRRIEERGTTARRRQT